MYILRGPGRKVAVPVLILPVLGWMLYVVGFAAFNNTNNFYRNSTLTQRAHRAELFWFPHWVVMIAGPFLFICSFLHLLIGRWFTGILTSFLTSLYLVCSGAVIHYWAVQLFDDSYGLVANGRYAAYFSGKARTDWLVDPFLGLWPLIEWIGALSSTLFFTFYMMMWPCFKTKKCRHGDGGGSTEENEMEEGEWDEEGEGKQEEEWEEEEEGEAEEVQQQEGEQQEGGDQEEATPSAPSAE